MEVEGQQAPPAPAGVYTRMHRSFEDLLVLLLPLSAEPSTIRLVKHMTFVAGLRSQKTIGLWMASDTERPPIVAKRGPSSLG